MAKDIEAAPTPKLRFPAFRNAGAWKTERMGELYSFKPTNSYSRDQLNYENGAVRNIHYGDIHTKFSTTFDVAKESVPFVNSGEVLPAPGADAYCREGDLVFADASEDLHDVGKCIEIVRLHGARVLAGQHTILARPNGGTLTVGFSGHLFRSDWVRSNVRREAQGTKVYGISPTRLARIPVVYPPDVEEQASIARCLTSLDELISAQSKKIEALRAHKRGLTKQIFPREGEMMPRLRFPSFRSAADWGLYDLGPLASKVGSGVTPLGGERTYQTAGRPFVRSQNVGWGELLLNDVAYIDEATHRAFDGTEIRARDVLLNITGASIGRSAVADTRIAGGNVNQHVCIIRVDPERLNAELLNQFLISENGQRQIASFQAGGNRQGLNFGQIRAFRIPLPRSVQEQQRIADCLSSLDARIRAESTRLITLQVHKTGLVQKLFPSQERN